MLIVTPVFAKYRNAAHLLSRTRAHPLVFYIAVVTACVGCGKGGINADWKRLDAEEAGYKDELNDIYTGAVAAARTIQTNHEAKSFALTDQLQQKRAELQALTGNARLYDTKDLTDETEGKLQEVKSSAEDTERVADLCKEIKKLEEKRIKCSQAILDAQEDLRTLADSSMWRMTPVTPPATMGQLHEALIQLLNVAKADDTTTSTMVTYCQSLLDRNDEFTSTVKVRPKKDGVADPVVVSIQPPVAPVEFDNVAGVRPALNISTRYCAVRVTENEEYGPTKMVVRVRGKERYFMFTHRVTYVTEGPVRIEGGGGSDKLVVTLIE